MHSKKIIQTKFHILSCKNKKENRDETSSSTKELWYHHKIICFKNNKKGKQKSRERRTRKYYESIHYEKRKKRNREHKTVREWAKKNIFPLLFFFLREKTKVYIKIGEACEEVSSSGAASINDRINECDHTLLTPPLYSRMLPSYKVW